MAGIPFELAFALIAGWLALVIGASVVWRRRNGKPVFPKRPPDALFWEPKASGRSLRNLLTMLGGAHNCLQVAVTGEALIVRPKFPFNLMFLPEIYGLEHEVPRRDIRSIEREGRLFGRTSVRIEFNWPGAGQITLMLQLKDPDAFAQALGRSFR